MVFYRLYNPLHNPTAPAFVTKCNICYLDTETGQGWHCRVCREYDVCGSCYKRNEGIDHPHNLTNHHIMADFDVQNKEAIQLQIVELTKMLHLLVHTTQCYSAHCQFHQVCHVLKGLFRHGIECKTRTSGGCMLCKKLWYLLHLHAKACKELKCHVPRCGDLKEHFTRLNLGKEQQN